MYVLCHLIRINTVSLLLLNGKHLALTESMSFAVSYCNIDNCVSDEELKLSVKLLKILTSKISTVISLKWDSLLLQYSNMHLNP